MRLPLNLVPLCASLAHLPACAACHRAGVRTGFQTGAPDMMKRFTILLFATVAYVGHAVFCCFFLYSKKVINLTCLTF